MEKYVSLVKLRLERFVVWRLEHILRDSNEKADALTVVAASLPIKEMMFLPSITSRVVNRCQPSTRDKRDKFMDDSNSPLFELGRTSGYQDKSPQDSSPGGSIFSREWVIVQVVSGRAIS